jgi:hypothetical protein
MQPDIQRRSQPMEVSWSKGPWAWAVAWTPVFALNLIVPLVLARGVIDGGGQAGMYCAIVLYWALGLTACAARPAFGRALVIGGLIVACTQFTPVLQFVAGFAAVMIGGQVGAESPELCGFIGVIITGGLLLIVAYLAGSLSVSLGSRVTEPPQPPSSATGGL